jgi:hypothetical protein
MVAPFQSSTLSQSSFQQKNKILSVINRQFMFVKEGIIEHYVQTLIYAKNYRYLDM